MPGLNPGAMNGHSDYGRYGQDRGYYTNGNFDQNSRDDPYRDDMRVEEEPLYRRPVRNGGARPQDRFNSDHLADQSSLSDFNSGEPAFELDHLATFAAGEARKGPMHVDDGLRKLRQMENTTGIWTMRCILLVERRFLVILDKNSGEELERFPMAMIQDPTSVFKNDRREIYNNLVLFTVMDTSSPDQHSDMHIFQSVRTPAQNIVDEILAAKRGQGRISSAGEAVLFDIFATHSIQIGGLEGQALRQDIAKATASQNIYHAHMTANQNAHHAQMRANQNAHHAQMTTNPNAHLAQMTANQNAQMTANQKANHYEQSWLGQSTSPSAMMLTNQNDATGHQSEEVTANHRGAVSSNMQHTQNVAGMRKQTHVVTQHTTTTTIGGHNDVEHGGGGVTATGQQRYAGTQDMNAADRHG